MKIIHMSDIHIGKSNNKKRFKKVVEWIAENQDRHQAKVVVITGDIVDDGSLNQYREVKEHIDTLKMAGLTVLAAPGNHDYGSNGIIESWKSVELFKKYVSGDVDYPYSVAIDGNIFIMLDSMSQEIKDHKTWGAQGKLGKQQLNDLSCMLDIIETDKADPGNITVNADTKVIVAMHHHPFYYKYFLKLRDDKLFKKVIMDQDRNDSRVNCLLFGHKHKDKRFTKKENKYNIDVIYAAASTTERTDENELIVPVIDLGTKSITPYDAS